MAGQTGNKQHWAAQNERGSRAVLALTAWLVRWLPVGLLRPVMAAVCTYFYITSPKQRRYIACYQARLQTAFPETVLPRFAVWRQFAAFGESVCDRFAVWQKKITYRDLRIDDPDGLSQLVEQGGRGQIFACSHFGNVEVCRALVSHHRGFKLNILVHSRHAQAFNEALVKAGADDISLIQVTDLDAALMLELERRISAGEWLAVAADREPVSGGKTVEARFLGADAPWPQGVWLLAALLKTKVNTLFCIKENGRYTLRLRYFTDASAWPRASRQKEVASAAARFAGVLAEECAANPLQWFNFYDFWKDEANG
ncbi:MAG: glycosyl transferase family 2 [Neisseria sp.]|nr:glycosyl transferase family 2 [Neisseria sp.]